MKALFLLFIFLTFFCCLSITSIFAQPNQDFTVNGSSDAHPVSEDTVPPTLVLFSGLAYEYMPPIGDMNLTADFFNHGSFDDVSAPENLIFSYKSDKSIIDSVFLCKNLTGYITVIDLEIFAWDEAGNYTKGNTKLQIIREFHPCVNAYGDSIPPIPVLKNPLYVEINENQITNKITPKDLDEASYDEMSGINTFKFENGRPYYQYSCISLGTHEVNIIITDLAGNVFDTSGII